MEQVPIRPAAVRQAPALVHESLRGRVSACLAGQDALHLGRDSVSGSEVLDCACGGLGQGGRCQEADDEEAAHNFLDHFELLCNHIVGL